MEATTTIIATLGETFTHTAWVEGDTPGVYDVEVGPRLTFRRIKAEEIVPGTRLMDAFGQPSITVSTVKVTTRTVRVTYTGWGEVHDTFTRSEVLNAFVTSALVPRG